MFFEFPTDPRCERMLQRRYGFFGGTLCYWFYLARYSLGFD